MTSFSQIFKHFRVNFATKERRRFFCPGNYEFRPVFHYKKFRFDVSTNCCGSERAFTYVATLEGYRCGSNFSPTPAFSRVRFWGASLLGSRRGIRKSLYPLFRIHDDGSLSLSPPPLPLATRHDCRAPISAAVFPENSSVLPSYQTSDRMEISRVLRVQLRRWFIQCISGVQGLLGWRKIRKSQRN